MQGGYPQGHQHIFSGLPEEVEMHVPDDSFQLIILGQHDPSHQPILEVLWQKILISAPGIIIRKVMRLLDAAKYKAFRERVANSESKLIALKLSSSASTPLVHNQIQKQHASDGVLHAIIDGFTMQILLFIVRRTRFQR